MIKFSSLPNPLFVYAAVLVIPWLSILKALITAAYLFMRVYGA